MTQRKKPRTPGEFGTAEPLDVAGSEEPDNIAQIEAEIDQTRNAISGDLRTLGERLSPEHLKEDAKEVMMEAKNVAVETMHEAKNVATSTFREAKDSAVDTVSAKMSELRDNVRRAERETLGFLRENAVPLSLIGIGVAWFVSNRRSRDARWDGAYGARDWSSPPLEARDGARRVAEGARELTAEAKDRAGRWVEQAEHKVGDVAGRVRSFAEHELDQVRDLAYDAEHRVGDAATRARDFAGRELREAREFSRHATETHPLAVGAAAVAAGIGVGMLLPTTRRESELLGSTREQLIGDAKGAVDDWSHTAKEAARNVKETLTGSPG